MFLVELEYALKGYLILAFRSSGVTWSNDNGQPGIMRYVVAK